MAADIQRWWRRTLTSYLEPLRRRFERRRGSYEGLRRRLNQAHMGVTYDDYLTRVAVTAVGGGIAVATLAFLALQILTVVTGGDLATIVLDAAIAGVAGLLTATIAWFVGKSVPRRRARRRARELDVMLPGAVAYMYALAHGGIDAVEIVRRLARREDIYGEQAREMQTIVNDMEYLGTDFMTALQHAADLTPCDATQDFLEDLYGVLESGGDVEEFLGARRDDYTQELTSQQDSYLETVGLFAEAYVGVLVAGPAFLLILLLVIGVLGASTLPQVAALVYLGLPLGTLFSIVLLDLLNSPFTQTTRRPPTSDPLVEPPDDPDAQAYAKRKRRLTRLDRLKRPFEAFVRAPSLSLYATVPTAAVAVLGLVAAGAATPTVEALRANPVSTTALLVVVPFLVVSFPLAILYELRRRFQDRIMRRFPDVLGSIARANRMGISTREAIAMEAERSSGVLRTELWKLHNDVTWFDDLSEAFYRLAGRARLAVTNRTLTLVAEANRASGNLHRTLAVAAEDARFQRQFIEARAREVASYVVVAVVSFGVFLGIVLLVQQFYLEQVVAAAESTSSVGTQLPTSLENIDVAGFRVAFFHATLVQAACIGLVTGKLSRGTVLAGVKYSVVMVLATVLAFVVI